MQLLSHPLIAIVFLIAVLIFAHELGHFIIGRLCGIGVETFSIGFGPQMFSFNRSGTAYQVAWLPLGGYVKFAGVLPNEEVADIHRGKEMHLASKTKRLLTIAAGPVANFLLAVLIYTILGMAGLEHPPSVVGTVRPDSPAASSGLQAGDRITAINGETLTRWIELRDYISAAPQQRLQLTVQRQQQELQLTLVPNEEDGRGIAGVGLDYEKAIIAVPRPASVAAQQGLRRGDEITSVQVEGKTTEITTFTQLRTLFASLPSQTTVFLHLLREDKEEAVFIPPQPEMSLASLGIASALLTIAEVKPPATALLPDDHIVAVGDQQINDVYDLGTALSEQQQDTAFFTVIRDGEERQLNVQLEEHIIQRVEGAAKIYTLPATFVGTMFRPPAIVERYPNPLHAVGFGVRETVSKSALVLSSLFGLFTGDVPLKALGGPIMIAKVAGDSAKAGWKFFCMTMAIISINLGLINLFPIPVLDGGQLVMVGMECVRRRRLSMSTIENYQRVGFVMVMCLVVLAFYNDLSRYWQTFLQSVAGFFD